MIHFVTFILTYIRTYPSIFSDTFSNIFWRRGRVFDPKFRVLESKDPHLTCRAQGKKKLCIYIYIFFIAILILRIFTQCVFQEAIAWINDDCMCFYVQVVRASTRGGRFIAKPQERRASRLVSRLGLPSCCRDPQLCPSKSQR